MLTSSHSKRAVLGITAGQRALLVAEVVSTGPAAHAAHMAEFEYPSGLSLDQGEALGMALGRFLKEKGFSANRVVLGVPAKWLILKPHAIPPADSETAVTMLRLHAESNCPPEFGEMVFDYLGKSNLRESSSLLLVGLPRRCLNQLLALAAGAKLKVLAVTPTASALATATAMRVPDSIVLSVRAEGAELTAQTGQQLSAMRYLGATTAIPSLVSELRRTVSLLPGVGSNGNGRSHADDGSRQRRLVLWDDVGIDAAALANMEAAAGTSIVRGDLAMLGGSGNGLAGGRLGASAFALTLPVLEGQTPAVDFLRPRLAAPKKQGVPRRTVWISAAAAAVLLIGIAAYADLTHLQNQVAAETILLQSRDPQLKIAKPFVADMEFAETFHNHTAQNLSCIRDLAMAVPTDGQTYLTNVHLHANMKGEFAGRSNSEQEVVSLLDKLSAGGHFTDLKRKMDARDIHGTGPEVTFSVTFTYLSRP